MKNLITLWRIAILILTVVSWPLGIMAQSNSPIVISEINYNPPNSSDETEYLELYNKGNYPINLLGYHFTDGIVHTFSSVLINPGEYLVLAYNASAIQSFFGVSAIQWQSGRLSNSGELIKLVDPQGLTVDSVNYGVNAPWPTTPNGGGPSLELCNPFIDNALPENWSAATIYAGTLPTGEPVWATPGASCGSWSGGPIANFWADNLTVMVGDAVSFFDISLGNPTQWSWTFQGGTPASSLVQNPDVVYNVPGDFDVCLTVNNGQGSSTLCLDNYIHVIQPYSDIVITEIMYNPPESSDSLDYIELYNNGVDPVNMNGFKLTAGNVNYIFPSLTFNPGAYLVLAYDTLAMRRTFGISSFKWNGGKLNNTGALIELKDNFGFLVDTVRYSKALPWDTIANGYGPSLVLCDPNFDNGIPGNWIHSVELQAINASGKPIYGTPGSACAHTVPEPDFSASPLTIVAGQAVHFTNLTQGYADQFDWDFEGGEPYADTTANPPAITYNIPGKYSVCLTAGNVYGDNTICKTHYIEVLVAAVPKLVITEIMYNPPETQDSIEFIEIYHNGTESINLEGYKLLAKNITFTFPSRNFDPGEYVLVAYSPSAIMNTFGLPSYGWNGGKLSNIDSYVMLMDNYGQLVDSVYYKNTPPWPTKPNGGGPSLVLCDPSLDNSQPENWIYATEYAATNAAGQKIYATPMAPCIYTTPMADFSADDTLIAVYQSVKFTATTLGACNYWNWYFEGGDPLTWDGENPPAVRYEEPGLYKVCLTVGNVYGQSVKCKPGYIQVGGTSAEPIVITEIMYNPPETNPDSLEFIELYNRGSQPINLKNFEFVAGIEYVLPDTTLMPESYLLIAGNKKAAESFYETSFLEWTSGVLANSGELIKLVNKFGVTVDSVPYKPNSPWDSLANGRGYSLELCNPNANNSLGQSWTRASRSTGKIVNNRMVYATPGTGCNMEIPTAAFTSTSTFIFPGEKVSFTDLSTGNPTLWKWSFPGGIPSQSTLQNPAGIKYSQPGKYKVCLKVSNVLGADSVCQDKYVFVATPGKTRLAITEIMYKSGMPDPDSLEFLEIRNNEDHAINLKGFSTRGVEMIFSDKWMEPGEYLVLARSSNLLAQWFGISAIQWGAGNLNNSGELVMLKDKLGYTIDSVPYKSDWPWPLGAAATGHSIQLCDPYADNSMGSNWSRTDQLQAYFPGGDGLFATLGFGCEPGWPVVVIRVDKNPAPASSPVKFTFEDLGGPTTAWDWYFEGGLPAYSDQPQPIVYFADTGWHAVKLVASNEVGSYTLYFPRFIRITKSLGVSEIPKIRITLTPNPTRGTFSLKADQELQLHSLEILSPGGTLIRRYEKPASSALYSVSDLAPGLYFVRLTFIDGSKAVIKLIVSP
ncbi:MAG: lamin tail domain-containing protein [Bacteroidales bacterium]